ncbi:SAM-dependent MidA family methyltransferase [Limnobacter thiooxidans]|uniref:Class I SAM-dependent methyltransferase n=1 Tax=Limnobacter thiooxidans TaxID=131080 RepID=A0AA86J1M1_9BURK|nr:SAM-dependent MidA family methyltransferase [Limnobacter thiooxidans]BET27363.1 class I SAM-dependent methyltransferase [Limnobacter thiooxidans]
MLSNFNQATRFDEFMHFALYNPQYGYYSRGEGIFGGEGDFVTAPELSPLFGQTLGKAIREVLPRCGGVVYEFGAGTGKLACDVLATAGDLITQYNIVDVSGGLKLVQLANLMAQHGPEIEKKVRWLSTLPDKLNGVILGNEVLDATPVRRFKWSNTGPLEAWVQQVDGALQLVWQAADPQFATTVTQLQTQHGPWPEGYESEVAEQSIAWVKTVTDRLNGIALMIDYGFHGALYYLPTRHKGTLRATSRHTAHDDFLAKVGEQDLTAHVNFSAVYSALSSCGGELEGYSHQGEFLLGHGILELATQQPEFTHPTRGAHLRQNLNTLLNEADMGEAFKVICWSKGVNAEGTTLNQAFLANDRSGDL